MIVRFAFVGIAVAALASPLGAAEATTDRDPQSSAPGSSLKPKAPLHARWTAAQLGRSGDAGPEAADEMLLGGVERTRPARRHVAPRMRVVSILPPPRPDETVALPANTIAEEPATTVAPVASATPLLPAQAASPAMVVSVMPPLRPSFAADPVGGPAQPNADVASALPGIMDQPAGKFVYVLPPSRPAFVPSPAAIEPTPVEMEVATPVEPIQPVQPAAPSLFASLFAPSAPAPALVPSFGGGRHNGLDGLISTHARLNGVPEDLVHRIVVRESRYNPRAVGRGGALGLMQIKHATARGLGYVGPASGLLDAETNLTYAVKYLAGAYRTAGGDYNRAVSYYARGYYYAAKRQGSSSGHRSRRRGFQEEAGTQVSEPPGLSLFAAAPANETR